MKKLIIALAPLLPATTMLVLANSAHAAPERLPQLLLGLWCSTSTPSSTYEKNGKCSKEEGNDSWFELSPDGYEDYVNSCKTVSITMSIVERRGLVPVYSLVYNCGGSGKIVWNKEITVLLQGETLTLLNTRSWDVRPEDAPKATLLRSLPADVQKYIEETRATCRSSRDVNSFVPSGDDGGLTQFTLGGRKAVLVDEVELCGGCFHGISCDNRGERDVRVYALFKNAWKMVLSNMNITGDIFVSYVPGKYRPEGQELNALVVDLYVGNKECPTRTAGSSSAQSYEARTCVIRWNGAKFTYKPL